MNLSIGTKIAAGYAVALLMLLIVGLTSYWNISELLQSAESRAHTFHVLQVVEQVASTLKDAETGQRGYLLTGEDKYLKPYLAAVETEGQTTQALRRLTADNPDQQRNLDKLEPLVATKLAELKETIELRKGSKGFDAALAVVRTDKGKQAMDDARGVMKEIRDEENRLLALRNSQLAARSQTTLAIVKYGIPLAFVLLAIIGLLITRTISKQLQESIALLSASSSEILATTTQVASGAAETATAVSETTATVEEVKQTAQMASQKAKGVMENAQSVAQVSQNGRKSVEDAVQGMHRIQEQMESIAESIVQLSEQSQAIGEIIATVNDLAEQSNMLAVNAALEATKAGEQGKGFIVVAQEVKGLAEQSKQATAQVRTILGDIQRATGTAVLATEQGSKAVEAGVRQSTETGEAIRQLAESIAEAAQSATQIAVSSQQQMVGMDQIALAMENIKQASIQNVAGTRQAESAAQGLHELGQRLGLLIGKKAA
ncbi:MAG TPA: CHASE3 domain-containing protein [Methylophilaceae bacterium]